MGLADDIVEAARAEIVVGGKPLKPEQVERALRPFVEGISFETKEQLQSLVRGIPELHFCLDHWMEANLAVNGRGPADRIEHLRNFLVMDRCECVLAYLPTAISHAKGPIDPRVTRTLELGPGVG